MDQKPYKEHFYKQPDEGFFITADFTDVMDDDETIVIGSCSVAAEDVDGTDVTSTLVDASSLAISSTYKLLVDVLKAGTVAASPYKITFTCVTSYGNTFELDVELRIIDL